MPLFKYKAAGSDGRITEVLIEGDSEPDSLGRLRQRGFTPLESFGQVESFAKEKSLRFWRGQGFDACDFTNRLAPLLKSHIPLERALGIIAQGADNQSYSRVVNDIRKGLHEGKKLSALIRDHGNRFPKIYSNLIEAGEETGSLTEIVTEIQRFLNEKKELKNFLVTSSIYPAFVVSVTSVVILLLFTVFIPRFSKIFLEMGKTLPLATRVMVGISDMIIGLWWLWLILIAVIAFLISRIRKGGKIADWWNEKLLKIPVLGELLILTEISRFLRTLAVLIQNHVHLLSTMQIAINVIINPQISKTFSAVTPELKGGAKLSTALGKSHFVPKHAVQMLSIGEESGNMGGMLNQVAEHYEELLRTKIKRLLALFEPVVILFLAGVIMSVVLSIFLAILEMQNM